VRLTGIPILIVVIVACSVENECEAAPEDLSEHMSTATRTLLLITVSSPDIQRVRRSRVLNFQQITMRILPLSHHHIGR